MNESYLFILKLTVEIEFVSTAKVWIKAFSTVERFSHYEECKAQ